MRDDMVDHWTVGGISRTDQQHASALTRPIVTLKDRGPQVLLPPCKVIPFAPNAFVGAAAVAVALRCRAAVVTYAWRQGRQAR